MFEKEPSLSMLSNGLVPYCSMLHTAHMGGKEARTTAVLYLMGHGHQVHVPCLDTPWHAIGSDRYHG